MKFKRIGSSLLVCLMVFSIVLTPNTKVFAENNEPGIGMTEEDTDMDDVTVGGNTGTPTTPTVTEGTGGNVLTDWTYTETGATITLTKYIGAKTDIVIPSTLDGKEVKIDPGTTEQGRTNFFPTTVTSIVIPDTTNKVEYANTNLSLFFTGKASLVKADLRGLDTSQVTDMSQSISRNSKLMELNITGWNTSNVTKANSMFSKLTILPTIEGLNTLDTSKMQDMASMFEECTWMTTIDVSKFKTSSATSIADMFMNCANVTEIDVSNFNTQNVTNMAGIVQGCSNLVKFDVSKFETEKVWSFARMFSGAAKLKEVVLSNFKTTALTQMDTMFYGCSSIKSLDFSKFDTTKVEYVQSMFAGCESLTSLDLSSFKFSRSASAIYPNNFQNMFYGCSSLTKLDMPNFGANKVALMKQMFANTNSLQVFDLSGYTLDKLQDTALGRDNVFTIAGATAKVPTVIITSSALLKTKFDTTITGRTYGGPFYNANGGTFADSKTTEQYFDHFVFTDKTELTVTKEDVAKKYTPTNTEAAFQGWYTDAECTTPFVADTTTIDLATPEYLNLQLYAGWEYKVTYQVNGGTVVPQETYLGGNLITEPPAPTKTGFDFDGWYKESTCTTEWNFASDKVSGNTTLYAKWKAKTWDITFEEDGGTPVEDTTAETDGLITKPGDPTREGYNFGGWYKESACSTEWKFASDTVSGNTTLYAKWEAKTWDITFEEDGGSPVEDTTAKTDGLITKPGDPTREGYNFDGWYKESTCKTEWNFASDKVSKDTTLYAKWEAKTWDITFEEDGGSPVEDTTAKTDGLITKPGDPTREGYNFDGWYKENTCKTEWKFASDTVSGNTTLYAKWEAKTWDITFEEDGGSPVEDATAKTDGLITKPGDPTKTGYDFDGWYKESTCKTLWNFASDKVSKNTTLYAKWEAKTWNITFDENGGTPVSDTTAKTDGYITKPGDTSKGVCLFMGWFKEAQCKTKWNFDTDKVYGDTTLYAGWGYTVTYNVHNGTPVASQVYMSGNLILEPESPTREGYDFGGWYKESTYDNKWNFTSDKVSKDTTLHAKWEAKTWNITFEENGGTTLVDITAKTDELIAFQTPPTKKGYTLDGWYTDASLTTPWNATTDTVKKDTTLYAKWIGNAYTLTLEPVGGQISTVQKRIVYGDAYGSLPTPVKAGATFKGWFTQELGKGDKREESDIVEVDKNETLYAYWVNDYFETNQGNIKFDEGQDDRYNLKIDEVNQDDIQNKEGLQSVYDIYFLLNDNRINVKDKNMLITIKLKQKEIGFEHYKVVYINEKGEAVEEYTPKVLDSKDELQFATNHLSTYAVYAWNDETPKIPTEENTIKPSQDNVNSKTPDTGDNQKYLVSLFTVLVFLSLMVVVFTFKTRNSKKKSRR